MWRTFELTASVRNAGILTIFLLFLLFLRIVPGKAYPTTVLEELPLTEFEELQTNRTIRMDQLPFASEYLNPCREAKSMASASINLSPNFRKTFFEHLSHYIGVHLNRTIRVLDDINLYNCSLHEINSLPNTPTLELLNNVTLEEAISRMYSSLVVHSMYLKLMDYQFQQRTCPTLIEKEDTLAQESRNLAKDHKTLACNMKLFSSLQQFSIEDVVMDDVLIDPCSRRVLRNCQVLRSSRKFLLNMSEYTNQSSLVAASH